MGIKAKILKELQKKPRRLKELKAKLGNDKKVARAVDELVERNKVVCRKGVYAVPDPKTGNAVECTLVKLAGKFGFARPVQPDGQDIFIPGKYLMGAMPGDTLLVSLFEHPRVEGSSEGEVLAVVKENNRFTGTVETIEGRLALVPDACPHCPIYIKKSADGGARDGEKAAVEILERGDSHEDHRAGVAMRFGSAEEAKQCAKALLYGAGLSRHFPLKAKAEAKKYEGAAVGEKEAAGRRDYRGMPVFTIDSAETKDIDDAISLEKTGRTHRGREPLCAPRQRAGRRGVCAGHIGILCGQRHSHAAAPALQRHLQPERGRGPAGILLYDGAGRRGPCSGLRVREIRHPFPRERCVQRGERHF